jgi:uncharacterized membrane protein
MPGTQPAWIRRSVLLLACGWPLSLHTAVLLGSPDGPARVNAAVAALGLLIWAAAAPRPGRVLLAVALVLILGATILYAPQVLLFAPPVVINALLAAFFGASLREGREPVICTFARIEQGGVVPPDLARHARAVTWLWALLLGAIAGVSLALAIWASLETWSFFANLLAYALLAALFVGEYLYRRVRFRHYRHATLVGMLRYARTTNLFARR